MINWLVSIFGINRYVFKRFFVRKSIDSKNDAIIPIVFVLIIMLSTVLIFLSSIELFKYEKQIKDFDSNEWNKVYNLFIGDCVIEKDSLESIIDDISSLHIYNRGRDYPCIVSIKSKDSFIDKIQLHLFFYNDTLLTRVLDDPLDASKPFIFIQKDLMEKVGISEGELVLIKNSGYGAFKIPLFAKPLMNSSKINCLICYDFISNAVKTTPVRFYFSKYDEFIELINLIWFDWEWPTPFYVGYNEKLFLVLSDIKQKISDKLLPIWYVSDQDSVSFKDSFTLTFKSKTGSHSFKHNVMNNGLDLRSKDIGEVILISDVLKSFSDDTYIDSLSGIDIFGDDIDINKLYVQFDFKNNFKFINKTKRKIELQEKILGYHLASVEHVNAMPLLMDEELKRSENSMIIYYNNFQDIELTKTIMKTFDENNIRWDNARWKTIIDLKQALHEGTKKIFLLLFVNFILIALFLIVKFLLRLKLELHTIGVIKCYGYSNQMITNTYIIGYFLLISVGFIFGSLLSAPVSYLFGFSTDLIANYYLSSYFLIYVVGFFTFLTICLLTIVFFYLKAFAQNENIYELIKYEG